jgi:hypothetical protein
MIDISYLKTIPINEIKKSNDTNCYYFVMGNDVVLYIGKTTSIKRRFLTHHKKRDFGTLNANCVKILRFEDTNETETSLIEMFKPELNITSGIFSELSKIAGISRSLVSRIFSGERSVGKNLALKLSAIVPGTTFEDWFFIKYESFDGVKKQSRSELLKLVCNCDWLFARKNHKRLAKLVRTIDPID